jgi:hypothetical protein
MNRNKIAELIFYLIIIVFFTVIVYKMVFSSKPELINASSASTECKSGFCS